MPQLQSRMDQSGWLTPSVADILEQGAPPPGGEETIRAQALEIQRTFTDQGTPVRVVNVRPTTSRTLYITRLDANNRFVKKQSLSQADVSRAFAQMAAQHQGWSLGFVPQLQEAGTFGILLRTEQHQPLRLRQLTVRNAFREAASPLTLALGVTLEQQMILRNLATIGHLLVVGSEMTRRTLMWNTLLSLIMFNTPAELRLALAGLYSQTYTPLVDTPHLLGRPLAAPKDGQRLLDGLVKEVQRRQQWFREVQVRDVDDYNAAMVTLNSPPLPRILFVIDSLAEATWQSAADRWTASVYDLVLNGANAGIHLIVTSPYEGLANLPDMISSALTTQVRLNSEGHDLQKRVRLPESALSFVDAVLVEQDKETRHTALELCRVSDDEIQRTLAYWRAVSGQRVVETPAPPPPSSPKPPGAPPLRRSGVTALFAAVNEDDDASAAGAAPPVRADASAIAKAAQALAQPGGEGALKRAQALAAYLGWIGAGPLQDVLGVSADEALSIIGTLQARGVLEAGDPSATLRFIRLSDNPFDRG